MLARTILLALICAGCYEPPSTSCAVRCTDACPDGLACVSGLCVRDGETCEGAPVAFAQVSVGGRHACGLDANGKAYCWGDNRKGQLGAGLADEAVARPFAVSGTWSTIAAGGSHTCALAEGIAYCWGNNSEGQARGSSGGMLGLPTRVEFGITPPPPFTKIVAGGANSCALGAGQVYCWGNKQLVGVDNADDVAVRLAGDNWSDIALGADFGCGVTSEGIKCWGYNNDGVAGLPGTPDFVTTPKVVPGFPSGTISFLEAGTNNACVVIDGALWCWGDAKIMGGDSGTNRAPARVGAEIGWTRVATGDSWLCGVLNGTGYCWGYADTGQLGSGLWQDDRARAAASVLGPADDIDITTREIDSSDRAVCLRTGAELRCWGDNTYGELGLGRTTIFLEPVEVPPPAGRTWTAVTAGWNHACGTLDDRSAMCWGRNDRGAVDPQKARGEVLPCTATECDATSPIPAAIANTDELVAGADFSCARVGGTIRCWGSNQEVRLGVSTVTGFGPTTLTAPAGTFTKLLPGSAESMCGLLSIDRVACWGFLGVDLLTMPTLQDNGLVSSIVGAGLGFRSACLIKSTGQRVCIGANQYGQLGKGDTTDATDWSEYSAPNVAAISSRYEHSCAVTSSGQITCWGVNDREQNGIAGSTPQANTPVIVRSDAGPLGSCTDVAVSRWHSCAVCDGLVYCWGENYEGQLGRGYQDSSHATAAPIDTAPGLRFVDVGALESGGCAVTTNGKMYCWGKSSRGQVGVGASAKNLPTPVVGAL